MADNNTFAIKVMFGGASNTNMAGLDNPNDPFYGEGSWVTDEVRKSRDRAKNNDSIGQGLLFNLGRQAVSSVVARIGSYTGDYITANQINNVSTVLGIGLALASGNPIAIAGTIFQQTVSAIDYENQRYKANLVAINLSMITGTSATNRSRGRGGKV